MSWPSSLITESGTSRLPLGSRITYIARLPTPSDAVAHVEIEHHVQRRPGVSAEHIDESGPLPGSDGRERVGEELSAAENPSLPVQVADQMRLAALIQSAEIVRVRLPVPRIPVDIIQRVPDLVAHHVRRR